MEKYIGLTFGSYGGDGKHGAIQWAGTTCIGQ